MEAISKRFYVPAAPPESGSTRVPLSRYPQFGSARRSVRISGAADGGRSGTEEDRGMTAMQLLQFLEVLAIVAMLAFTAYVQP